MVLADMVVVSQGKVSLGVLTTAVKSIVETFDHAAEPLQAATGHVTRSLALIEVGLGLVAVLMGDRPMNLLRRVLTVAAWMWIIDVFHSAAKAFMKLLMHAAASAFGGGGDVLLQPSKILEMATKATAPMLDKLLNMHVVLDIGTALLLGLVLVAIMIAYIALALSIALASIEFYLYLALSGLLLPFAVLGHTRFLADKAINAVIACAIKLAVIGFIVSAVEPILATIKFEPGLWNMLTWRSIWALLVVAGLCCSLALWAPRLAAGFLYGSPSLSGTAVVAEAASAGAALMSAGVQMGAAALNSAQGSFQARQPPPSGNSSSSTSSQTSSSGAAPNAPVYIFVADQMQLRPPENPQLPAGNEAPLLPPGA